MKTMYLDVSIPRIALTRLLGKVSANAYFSGLSPLHLQELSDPPLPRPDWVRVKNSLCGICGSDLHQLFVDVSLDVAPAALPAHKRIYLGHEMVGTIIEVGPAATGFAVGDRVTRWGRANDCLSRGLTALCPACERGHRVLCEMASEPWDYHPAGGGFGDTFITPAASLVPVLPGLSDEQAIFIEPVAVAIHAGWRCIPKQNDKVLIIGCGTIGFLLIQTVLALQPDCEITAVAQFSWQADMARQYGAKHIIMVNDDGFAETARLTGAKLYQGKNGNRMLLGGFDVIFDVVGIPATLNQALRWAKAGGSVVLVGVNLHKMTLDVTPVWYQEVNLIGAVGHDIVEWQGESISTFDLAMQWMDQGRITIDGLLTHRFPLHDYRRAFQTAINKAQTHSVKVAFEL